MTHALWDVIPPVPIRQSLHNSDWHASPDTCSEARCQDTLWAPETKTLRGVLMESTTTIWLCQSEECNAELPSYEVYDLLDYVVATQSVLNYTTKSTQDVLMDIAYALELGRNLGYALLRTTHPELYDALERVGENLDQVAQGRVMTLRNPTDQAEVMINARDGQEQAEQTREYLLSTGLGDQEATGLLVGPVADSHGGSREVTVLVLCEELAGANKMVIGPLGVLSQLVDQLTPTRGYAGVNRQLIPLPKGLTPALKETILGLYEPGSMGPMGNLLQVAQAARSLHQDTN